MQRKLHFAILAGGQLTRFGSPKVVCEYQEEPLILRIFAEILALSIHIDPIYLSVKNRTQWKYILSVLENFIQIQPISDYKVECSFSKDDTFQVEAIYDSTNELEFSPIFGIYSVFQQVVEGYVQIIPCNLPYFTHIEIEQLLAEFQSLHQIKHSSISALVPRWNNGDLEPLISLYSVEKFLDIIELQIIQGNYDLEEIFAEESEIFFCQIEDLWPEEDRRLQIFERLTEDCE